MATKTRKAKTKTREGYNADQRAAEREGAPIVVDGVNYTPVRQTTAVMRDVRAIGRAQSKLNRQSSRLERQAGEKYEAADAKGLEADAIAELEAEAEALEKQADELSTETTSLTFKMLSVLLATAAGEHPEPEHLEAHMDLEDAGELADYLVGKAEDEAEAEDPTTPTPTTTT